MVNHKKLVNIYLPEELYQALIAYQDLLGFEESSEAVVQIMTQFFHKGLEVKRYATVKQFETLEGQVTHMSKQIAQLTQLIASTALSETAKTVPTLDNKYTRPDLTAQQSSTIFLSSDLDEDEPDEILLDFLEPESPPSSSR